MRSRSQAVQSQIEELWRLNQMCDTDFDHLANAVKHAYEMDYINTAERDRLDMVNKAGNEIKGRGFICWSPWFIFAVVASDQILIEF